MFLRRRVLVVDPDEQMRAALEGCLDRHFDLDAVDSAEAGAALLEVRHYHAIISRFGLPLHDGAWLLRIAAARQPAALRILIEESEASLAERARDVQFTFLKTAAPLGRLVELLL